MPPKLSVTCIHCQKRLGVNPSLVGKTIQCPVCQKALTIRSAKKAAAHSPHSPSSKANSQGSQPVDPFGYQGTQVGSEQRMPSNYYQSKRKPPRKTKGSTGKKVALIGGAAFVSTALLATGIWVVLLALSEKPKTAAAVSETPEVAQLPDDETSPSIAEETSDTVPESSEPLAEPEPVPDVRPSRAEQLLREQKIALRSDIVQRVEECLERVEEAGYGHVIVGQIEVEGGGSPRDVISQMEILDGGYFVDAVATAGAPVFFFLNGYERLDVIPHGKAGNVENTGAHQMKRLTGPKGILKGRLVKDDLRVPKQQIKVSCKPMNLVLNQCSTDRWKRSENIIDQLKVDEQIDVKINQETGQFEISGLQPIHMHYTFRLHQNASFWLHAEIKNGEVVDLGTRKIHTSVSISYESDEDQISPSEDLAENGISKTARLLKNLEKKPYVYNQFKALYERSWKSYESMSRRYQESKKQLNQEASSHPFVVLVGQLRLPVKLLNFPVMVYRDMIIHFTSEGHFAVRWRRGRPFGFHLHGFDPIELKPKGSEDGVEYWGLLRMKKTRKSDKSSIVGLFKTEGGSPARDVDVSVEDGATYVGTQPPIPYPKARLDGNQFELRGFSPILYYFSLKATGFVTRTFRVSFGRGEDRRLTSPIELYRTRRVTFTYILSETNDAFDGSVLNGYVDLHTSNEQNLSKLLNDSHGHLARAHNGKLGDYFFRQLGGAVFSKPALETIDLGLQTIGECRLVNAKSIFGKSYNSYSREHWLRPGHVYLIRLQPIGAQNQWALFRVNEISLAPFSN